MSKKRIASIICFVLAALIVLGAFGFYFLEGIKVINRASEETQVTFNVAQTIFGHGNLELLGFKVSIPLVIAMAVQIILAALFVVALFKKLPALFFINILITISLVIIYALAPLLVNFEGDIEVYRLNLGLGYPLMIIMLFLGHVMYLVGYFLQPKHA